jgi:hypothetical protein
MASLALPCSFVICVKKVVIYIILILNIVAYVLEAIIVEPEETSIARERYFNNT